MQQIKIGKASTNDFIINDPSVSREHLIVFIDDDKNVFITDLGSTNGTYVNGVQVKESVKLEKLDVLRVGNSLVEWPRFLLSDDNLEKVYETLNDPTSVSKEKPGLKSIAINLNPIYKYSLIFALVIVVVIIIMSFADQNTNYDDEVASAKSTVTETTTKRKQQKKQRTSVTYDFSCLSNNEDIGSNDAIYNFGELTREVQNSFFDGIDISVDDEQDAGNGLFNSYKKEYRFIKVGTEFKNLNSILRNLVSRLAKPRGFNYKIHFVDDPMLNAVTAGGQIFFFKGMYDFCNTNSEIAAIISHEIAHNELGHLTLGMKKQKAANDWGLLGEIVLGIENATTQSFNQKQESEADLFGMDLVYPTSFRNCDAITLWKRMSQDENEFDIVDNFFRSHPYSKNRSKCIRNHLTTNYNKNCN
tara:strand:+ start:185 stop:1432 length:1248 start_codon:yes stop_codon:yes gene_type:complete